MKKRKLNYRFHNPNTSAETADYILKVFMEVNARKVEAAIREAVGTYPKTHEETNCCEGHPT